MSDTTIDVIGWIGAVALLIAYGFISAGRMKGDQRRYQVLNLAGSAGLIVNSAWYGAYPSTFVNVIWIGIAIVALARILRRRSAVETAADD